MRVIVDTTAGSLDHVIRTHSFATDSALSDGSPPHASRPNANQFPWLKSDPVQFESAPTFATPAMAVREYPWSDPSMTFAMVDPCPRPFAQVSASSTSLKREPR